MSKKNLEKKPIPNSWVEEIPDYTPGKHKGAGVGPLVILSANENPHGSSPKVEAVKKIGNHRYPDSLAVALKKNLADFYNLSPNQISLGAGSDEVLLNIAKSFLSPGRVGITSQYGFLVYPIAIKSVGAELVVANDKKNDDGNFCIDLDAMLQLVDARETVIFLANPNNPTGTMASLAEIKNFLTALPSHILVVLDVAYAEYVDDSDDTDDTDDTNLNQDYNMGVMGLLSEFSNLLVVRTFSKIYGLASLRLGFCAGDSGIIKTINKLCGVFNTSQIAQDAGVVALGDQDFINQSRAHNKKEKLRLQGVLRQNGFHVYASATNFYLLELGDATRADDFVDFMESHNVFVRAMKSYGLATAVRVTVGSKEENDIFLQWAAAWAEQKK